MKTLLSNVIGFDPTKVVKQFSSLLSGKVDRARLERMLLLEENKIGSQIFGQRRPGHRRDFFLLDEKTWVWNEQVDTPTGSHIVTTRYIVEGNRVYKVQDGGSYQQVEGEELQHLCQAAQIYTNKVRSLYATL